MRPGEFQADAGRSRRPLGLSLNQSLLLVWPQVVALVGLLVALFAAAYIGFLRQEIRA